MIGRIRSGETVRGSLLQDGWLKRAASEGGGYVRIGTTQGGRARQLLRLAQPMQLPQPGSAPRVAARDPLDGKALLECWPELPAATAAASSAVGSRRSFASIDDALVREVCERLEWKAHINASWAVEGLAGQSRPPMRGEPREERNAASSTRTGWMGWAERAARQPLASATVASADGSGSEASFFPSHAALRGVNGYTETSSCRIVKFIGNVPLPTLPSNGKGEHLRRTRSALRKRRAL